MTNLPAISNLPNAAPDLAPSLVRVAGALLLVVGLFLAGAWLFKNWRRLLHQTARAPKLNILEVKSLGQRHAIYVVGYEQQRLLIASSPGGVSLLSHLPAAGEKEGEPAATTINFAAALQDALGRK